MDLQGAPDGNSFSFPATTAIFDYGAGAEVGSTFTAKFLGLLGHVPGGIASDAGLVILAGGVVVGFDEFGIPLVACAVVCFKRL